MSLALMNNTAMKVLNLHNNIIIIHSRSNVLMLTNKMRLLEINFGSNKTSNLSV